MYDKEFLRYFSEAEGFINWEDYNSAAICLAIVHYFLTEMDDTTKITVSKSHKINFNLDKIIQGAKQELNKRIESVSRIILYGSKWEYEELVLLIQLRIDIDYLINFLSSNGEKQEIDFSTISSIDEWFSNISKSNENRKDYSYAVKAVKKHANLPIEAKWNNIFGT